MAFAADGMALRGFAESKGFVPLKWDNVPEGDPRLAKPAYTKYLRGSTSGQVSTSLARKLHRRTKNINYIMLPRTLAAMRGLPGITGDIKLASADYWRSIDKGDMRNLWDRSNGGKPYENGMPKP